LTFVPPKDSRPRQTLASAISSQLRHAIMRGELPPGGKLHVADLQEKFAVSLSPLREALSRLGSEGLLEIEDLRGYRVAAVSADNLTEVICLRTELEILALREAMARSDAGWVDRLKGALLALESCPRFSGDEAGDEAWELGHRRFHMALLAGCEMPMLLAFLNTLHDLSDRYRRLFLQTHPPDRDVPSEHRRLYEAASLGEVDVACALLRQHIQRTGRNVRAALLERRDSRPV
jgi:GntR family carbon starvation induced transcriptional regulator